MIDDFQIGIYHILSQKTGIYHTSTASALV